MTATAKLRLAMAATGQAETKVADLCTGLGIICRFMGRLLKASPVQHKKSTSHAIASYSPAPHQFSLDIAALVIPRGF